MLCVCMCVTTKCSTWYVYMLKVRNRRILLKSFDVWISFSLKVMVLFAYQLLEHTPFVLQRRLHQFNIHILFKYVGYK